MSRKVLTNKTLHTLLGQHPGTGWLILKTGNDEWCEVEVFVRPRDGVLCRITDGKPALPVDITYEESE